MNTESLKPSSCFRSPFSKGQSLARVGSACSPCWFGNEAEDAKNKRKRRKSHMRWKRACVRKSEVYFLFVLIWPTCPQFAHFRCVPAGFDGTVTAAGELGETGESAAPSVCTPFCLSRASLRSLLRSRRMSSASSLEIISKSVGRLRNRITFVYCADFGQGHGLF